MPVRAGGGRRLRPHPGGSSTQARARRTLASRASGRTSWKTQCSSSNRITAVPAMPVPHPPFHVAPASLSGALTCWTLRTGAQLHDRGKGQRPRLGCGIPGAAKSHSSLVRVLFGDGLCEMPLRVNDEPRVESQAGLGRHAALWVEAFDDGSGRAAGGCMASAGWPGEVGVDACCLNRCPSFACCRLHVYTTCIYCVDR